MFEQRIEQQFIDSADLKYQAAQLLSKPIAAAVQAMPSTLRRSSWAATSASGLSWQPLP
jgi:D-sedoheptulose 7-phosphate isomerase